MDKSTSLLIKSAAVVVIASGSTGIVFMLNSAGVIDFSKTVTGTAKEKKTIMGNLGEADGSTNTFSPNIVSDSSAKTFDIWCKTKENECQVTIDSERLRVNGGIGIVNEQILYSTEHNEVNVFKKSVSTIKIFYKKDDGTKSIGKFLIPDRAGKWENLYAWRDAFKLLTEGGKSGGSTNNVRDNGSVERLGRELERARDQQKVKDLKNRLNMEEINKGYMGPPKY